MTAYVGSARIDDTESRCCLSCRALFRNDFARCPIDGSELRRIEDDPMVGQIVAEHYAIDALLGEGAMGRVYLAHHTRLERRRYALKILLGDLATTTSARIRFAQEAEMASVCTTRTWCRCSISGRPRAGSCSWRWSWSRGRRSPT